MKSFNELHTALQSMIHGTHTMSIPAKPDEDEDLILAQGLSDYKELVDRAGKAIDDVMLQVSKLSIQDYENLNILCIQLAELRKK